MSSDHLLLYSSSYAGLAMPAKLIEPPPMEEIQYFSVIGLGSFFESMEKSRKKLVETIPKPFPSIICNQAFFDPITPSSSSSQSITKNKVGYSSIFVDKLLDNPNVIYRWDVKIKNLNSWFAIGVATSSAVTERRISFTPFDEHGQFVYSANGYIWDRRIVGDPKALRIEGGTYGVEDVVTVELDAKIRQVTFLKNGIQQGCVKNLVLPLYPSFMLHGTESFEFFEITESVQ